jgi:hypothetical protein
MSLQPVSVLTGWLMGRPGTQRVVLAGMIFFGLFKIIWWSFRNPKYSIPVVLGVLSAIQWGSLLTGFWVTLIGFGGSLWLWGRNMIEYSEIDTWNELRHGLPRLWRVHRQWPVIAAKMQSPSLTTGGEVPAIGQLRLSTSGVIATVDTSSVAKHVSVLKKHEFNIATGFKADRVLFRSERNWLSTVRIDWGAHLRREYTLHDIPASSNDEVWPFMLPFGITESGKAAEILANEPILLGGVTGSGKSGTAWAILAAYIRLGVPLEVDVIDWSGTEFGFLKQFVGQGIVKSYVGGPETPKEAIDATMKRFLKGMTTRLKAMERDELRLHVPTAKEPLRLLLVDEGLPISDGMRKQGMDHPLILIASQGRKANYIPLLNTQAAQKDVLGVFRDLTATRLSLRTTSRFMTEVVLGEGCEGDGAKCSYLDAEHDKGVGYMPARGGFQGFRAAKVSDADIRSLALGEWPDRAVEPVDDAAKPRIVYTLWNSTGENLYVGQTRLDRGTPVHELDRYTEDQLAQRAAANRMAEHVAEQPWGGQVLRVTVRGIHQNLAAGLDAEELLIRTERPLHNKIHADYNRGLTNA